MKRLVAKKTAVLVIDVQERLAAAMPKPALDLLIKNTGILLAAAERLGAPVIATEQYPQGLGPTVAPIREKLRTPVLEKRCFSAAECDDVMRALAKTGATDVVLAGMESHVCVFQTARSLVSQSLTTWVLRDAVCSRTEENRQAGLELCRQAGALLSVTEAVLFDWLQQSGTDDFRAISKLVR
jgi:nicotinamidase-related amidase